MEALQEFETLPQWLKDLWHKDVSLARKAEAELKAKNKEILRLKKALVQSIDYGDYQDGCANTAVEEIKETYNERDNYAVRFFSFAMDSESPERHIIQGKHILSRFKQKYDGVGH